MEFFGQLLSDNPYFSAGAGLLGVGAALAVLRQGALRGLFLLQRRYLTTVEITSRDPAYQWTTQWLAHQALSSGNHFTVTANVRSRPRALTGTASIDGSGSGTKAGFSSSQWNLSPAPGIHFLRWRGAWIRVQRERERGALLDLSTGQPFETITLTTVGRRPVLFTALLADARALVASQETGRLLIYTSWAGEWRPFGNGRRPRRLDSIILGTGVKERLVDDVREFLASAAWYEERGIPYRRGYLLWGPPGGGKSSFVQALASELGYSICLLNLAEGSLTDDRLHHLLNVLPERSILLLEDIDCAINNRCVGGDDVETLGNPPMSSLNGRHHLSNPSPHHLPPRVTLSGLLNALDGVASAEERLIFMTTNYRERLDPALIRPGRVDVQQHVGLAEEGQLRALYARFYPQHVHLAEMFATRVAPLCLSPAAVQGHFIRHKGDPLGAATEEVIIDEPGNTDCKGDESIQHRKKKHQ